MNKNVIELIIVILTSVYIGLQYTEGLKYGFFAFAIPWVVAKIIDKNIKEAPTIVILTVLYTISAGITEFHGNIDGNIFWVISSTFIVSGVSGLLALFFYQSTFYIFLIGISIAYSISFHNKLSFSNLLNWEYSDAITFIVVILLSLGTLSILKADWKVSSWSK